MDNITKSPTEKFPIYFNFSSDMIAGETISTKTLTCKNAATGVSSKATIVDNESIVNTDVVAVVKAGTEDDEHSLQCVVVTNNGNTYQRDLLLRIQSVVDDSFTKQPDDAFLFDVDFTRRLESGDTVASAVIVAILESDGTAASITSTPAIVTPKVGIPAYGGTDGETYRLGIQGTTAAGYVYEKFVRMNVQEY
ncbi:MAG: hypothetical protein E4G97_00785 [Deltaproteobacteria bacterium]|nr:MAG: hypothetical protein E4G97_00785 [Deltaproteobacteria bacterium]